MTEAHKHYNFMGSCLWSEGLGEVEISSYIWTVLFLDFLSRNEVWEKLSAINNKKIFSDNYFVIC